MLHVSKAVVVNLNTLRVAALTGSRFEGDFGSIYACTDSLVTLAAPWAYERRDSVGALQVICHIAQCGRWLIQVVRHAHWCVNVVV